MIASTPQRSHTIAVFLKSETFRRRISLLAAFIAGQGSAQLLSLAGGFFVLRWLDIPSFALYGLTFSFQTTASFLVDLSFSTTVVALVGQRFRDRAVIGGYVRAGRHLRNRMLAWTTPLFAVAFFLLTWRFHLLAWQKTTLLASILTSLWFSGLQAYYGPSLLVQRRVGLYYRIQSVGAAFRLAAYFAFYLTGLLNAFTAVWINATGFVDCRTAVPKDCAPADRRAAKAGPGSSPSNGALCDA